MKFNFSDVQVSRLKVAADTVMKLTKAAITGYNKAGLATMVADAQEGAIDEAIRFLDGRQGKKCELSQLHCDALSVGLRKVIKDLLKEIDDLDRRHADCEDVRGSVQSYRDLLTMISKGATDPEFALNGPRTEEEAEELALADSK